MGLPCRSQRFVYPPVLPSMSIATQVHSTPELLYRSTTILSPLAREAADA